MGEAVSAQEVREEVRRVRERLRVLAPLKPKQTHKQRQNDHLSVASEDEHDEQATGLLDDPYALAFGQHEERDESLDKKALYKVGDRVMFKHYVIAVGMVHACGIVLQTKTHWITDEISGEQHKGGFSYQLKCQSLAERKTWLEEEKVVCLVSCEPNENVKPVACDKREQEGLPSGFT